MRLTLRTIRLSSSRPRASAQSVWGPENLAEVFMDSDGTYGFSLYGTDVRYVTETGYLSAEAAEAAAMERYDNECQRQDY
jgi:hypothetical protein